MKSIDERKEEIENNINYNFPMTASVMQQLIQDIKTIPKELITVPEKAYRPDNFNLEVVDVLQKHSEQLQLDPGYINKLKHKFSQEDQSEPEPTPQKSFHTEQDHKESGTWNLNWDGSIHSENIQVDSTKIEEELKRLRYINKNMEIKEKAREIDIAHLDHVLKQFEFDDIQIDDARSQGDTSVDNDFWEDFNLENDANFGNIPKINVNRSHSQMSHISNSKRKSSTQQNSQRSNR